MNISKIATALVLTAGLTLTGCSGSTETPKAQSTSVDWNTQAIKKAEVDAMPCENLDFYRAGRELEAKMNPDNANAQALVAYTHSVIKYKCSDLAKKLGL